MSTTLDAVVIGASMRGLVAATLLDRAGRRTVVVDRSRSLGGSDGSFTTAGGSVFDHGLHVLDADRSAITSELLLGAVGGALHRTELRRALVLRGHVVPYAPTREELPDELARLLPPGELVDDLGDDLPTRERLAGCYGRGYVDFVFDEVLPSFPSEARHLAFGVDEARLLVNVYPWFFPRVQWSGASTDESRAFHDRLRAGVPQAVLCPPGGFGRFAAGLAAGLDPDRVEVVLGAADLAVEVRPGTHTITSVTAGGRRLTADRYLWAAGWPQLCALLDLPCQDAATDRVHLGSFRLDRPASTPHHELLVGDPALHVNRIHLPGELRGTSEPLLQVEFAVPVADDRWPQDPDHWRSRWEADCRALGLLEPDHRVEEFDHRAFVMHFNGFGAEGEPLRDADPSLLRPDSNVVPIAPSMANLNLNRWVPRAVEQLTGVLGGDL